MRKAFLIFALLALAFSAKAAPEMGILAVEPQNYTIYLPIITRGSYMSNWKIIVPEGTTNLILNPSIEEAITHWTTGGTNTIVRSSEQSKFGAYSAKITYSNNTALANYADDGTITLVANQTYVFGMWIYVPAGWDGGDIYLTTTGFVDVMLTINQQWEPGDDTDTWVYIETEFTLSSDNIGALRLVTTSAPSVGKTLYIDAAQLENKTDATTYCDGDQEGCEWEGDPHDSHSIRSVLSRAGGIVKDLRDDYCFGVKEYIGIGLRPQVLNVDEFAIIPGGFLNSIKVPTRQFTLVGELVASDCGCDLHDARQALIDILDPLAVPMIDGRPQPIILRYTGADEVKEITAHYDGGLEAVIRVDNRIHERISMRFLAEDPFWYGIGEDSQFLDIEDTVTLYNITARLKNTGQWDTLGITSSPTGGSGDIYALARGNDGSIYVGGDFTDLDGVSGRDHIARYDPATATWNTVGGSSAIRDIVRGLAVAPNGDLYVVGDFTDAGGLANADYVARWDGSSWYAVGVPEPVPPSITSVDAVAVDRNGDVIVGGNFTDFASVAAADYIAKWDLSASAWVAIGNGLNATVRAVEIDANNQPWAGGDFTQEVGASPNSLLRIGYFDGTNWVEPGGGFNSSVRALAVESNGTIYAGGNFTQTGDAAVTGLNYIASWNWALWSALGDGLDNSPVYVIEIAPDGWVWVGGLFDTAGDLSVGGLAKFTKTPSGGVSWAHPDIFITGNPTPRALLFGMPAPVVSENYDVFVGFSAVRSTLIPGITTLTNNGSAIAKPVIAWERTGGGGVLHNLMSIRNETTGKTLIFNYPILDGERLTVDISDGSVESSFFGSVPQAILPSSDIADFGLLPGDNDITAYRRSGGAGTVTAYILWRETYSSLDK